MQKMFLFAFFCLVSLASIETLPDVLNVDCSLGQPFKQEDPLSCQRYFECIDEKPILYFCPMGTFFDIGRVTCVHQNLVDCGSRDPKLYECNEKMPKRQPNDAYCGSYFICSDDPMETPAFVFCPSDQNFDIDSLQCMNKNLVECHGRRTYTVLKDPILQEWKMFNWVYIWMSTLGIGGTLALLILVCWMVQQTQNLQGYEKLGIDCSIEMQETSANAAAYSNLNDKEEEKFVNGLSGIC